MYKDKTHAITIFFRVRTTFSLACEWTDSTPWTSTKDEY